MSKSLAALAVSSLIFGACAKKGPEPQTAMAPIAPTTTTVVAEPAAPPPEPTPLPAPPPVAEQPAPVAATLTDAQIVKVLETIDSGEIEQAKVAQKKSKNPAVKKFAAHMIQQHTKAKAKGMAWAKKNKLTPEESPVSQDLTDKGAAQLASLNGSDTALFDGTYIAAQATQHGEALTLINAQLEPNAQSPELKSSLGQTRTMVQSHLDMATALQEKLASAATAQPNPNPPAAAAAQ